MTVNAVVPTQAQAAPQTQTAQDSGGTDGLFAFLMKHRFGGKVSGATMLDSQSMLSMVGNAPEVSPTPNTQAAAAPVNANQTQAPQTQQNQAANSQNANGQQAQNQGVANNNGNAGNNANSNANGNGGSSSQNQQQASTDSNQSGQGPVTTQAVAANTNSSNATDTQAETDAAALAVAILIVQQVQAQAQPAPVAQSDAASQIMAVAQGQANAGPVADNAATQGPSNSTGPSIQAALAAANDADDTQGPAWTANFLNSGATTPVMAQQAQALSQIAGPSGGSVSVQTSSTTGNAAPSASALVPNAILAISEFFTGGQSQDSGSNDTTDQNQGQATAPVQTTTDSTDTVDQLLAADAQALLALQAVMQAVVQDFGAAAAQPQALAATQAATAAAAETSSMPTPTAPTSAPTEQANNFAGQLQEATETQEPKAPQALATPGAAEQIKMQIENGLRQGSTTIKVQLTPNDMGKVEIKLDVQNGAVKAVITADRPDTLQILRSDQAGMLQALQDAGLTADSNSLSFYLRGDQQRQFAQTNGRQGRGSSGGSSNDNPSATAGVEAVSDTASAQGAVDISV